MRLSKQEIEILEIAVCSHMRSIGDKHDEEQGYSPISERDLAIVDEFRKMLIRLADEKLNGDLS